MDVIQPVALIISVATGIALFILLFIPCLFGLGLFLGSIFSYLFSSNQYEKRENKNVIFCSIFSIPLIVLTVGLIGLLLWLTINLPILAIVLGLFIIVAIIYFANKN